MTAREKKLLACLRSLSETDAEALLAFAEFLSTRGAGETREIPAPADIPRPDEETVVGAIKRLSATYPMLNKSKMLNETSVLMAQHVMQGREADEVIEELEIVFRRHYEALLTESER